MSGSLSPVLIPTYILRFLLAILPSLNILATQQDLVLPKIVPGNHL